MSLNRYAKKRDANERDIIDALERHGYVVEQLDVCDLLVTDAMQAAPKWLLEVKSKRGKLTPRQIRFRQKFRTFVVRDAVQALAAVSS
jgi:hypothetical protein